LLDSAHRVDRPEVPVVGHCPDEDRECFATGMSSLEL
jgi:hypothetical protein